MASRLEEMQKAALPTTGLVPMQMRVSMTPYAEGQVVGFPPEVAIKYEQAGAAVQYSGGEDGPNVTGPRAGSFSAAPVVGPHGVPMGGGAGGGAIPAIRSTLYDNRPEVTPRAQSINSINPGDSTQVEPAVLPEGWRDFSAVQLRELAASLSGRPFVELSQDDSVKIVEAAEAGKRVGRGDYGIEGDERGMAHVAGGDEALAESHRASLDARTDQPEVETRARRGRPPKVEE